MTPAIAAGLVVGGAVGAPVRYLVDEAVQTRARGLLPWGTLLVNVTGSFILGVVTGAVLYHGLTTTPKVWLGTGFCGAYTTFSTFTFEVVRLVEEGRFGVAARYAVVSVSVGAAAAAAGLALAAAV